MVTIAENTPAEQPGTASIRPGTAPTEAFAEALEAGANRKKHGFHLGELVGLGARIVLECNAGAPNRELDLEAIQALAN